MIRLWLVLCALTTFGCAATTLVLPMGSGCDLASGRVVSPLEPSDFIVNPGIDELVTLTFAQATATVLSSAIGSIPGGEYPYGTTQPDLPIGRGQTLAVQGRDLRYYKLQVLDVTMRTVTLRYWPTPAPGGVVAVQVSPRRAYLWPGHAATFAARALGLADSRLLWTIPPGDTGALTAQGDYVAPPEYGTHTVTASSATDPACAASVSVDVYRDPAWLLGAWVGEFPPESPLAGEQLLLVVTHFEQPDITRPLLAYAGRLYLRGALLPVREPTAADDRILWSYHHPGAQGQATPGESLTILAAFGDTHRVTLYWEAAMSERNTPKTLDCAWTVVFGDIEASGSILLRHE